MDKYDGIVIGNLASEAWLNSGVVNSNAINTMYDLKYRSDLTAQSDSVKNMGETDTSNVYEIVQRFEQNLNNTITNGKLAVDNTYLTQAHEEITKGLKNINTDHVAIHMGLGFCGNLYLASLAGSASKVWRIKGPTELYAHIKSIQISCEGSSIRARLVKDPTITNVGTEENVIRNLNHNSTRTPTTKFYDGTVAYTGGTTWCSVIVHADTSGTGINTSSQGGNFIQSDYLEYITKTGDEDYILEITNLKTDVALNIQVDLFFYEEPQGLI